MCICLVQNVKLQCMRIFLWFNPEVTHRMVFGMMQIVPVHTIHVHDVHCIWLDDINLL